MRSIRTLPGFPQTIYVAPDEVTLLSRLITTFGGTKTRATVEVMETPNQPVGSAVDVMRFWTRYFPTRQGHWGGWVVETYPTIGQIEFPESREDARGCCRHGRLLRLHGHDGEERRPLASCGHRQSVDYLSSCSLSVVSRFLARPLGPFAKRVAPETRSQPARREE